MAKARAGVGCVTVDSTSFAVDDECKMFVVISLCCHNCNVLLVYILCCFWLMQAGQAAGLVVVLQSDLLQIVKVEYRYLLILSRHVFSLFQSAANDSGIIVI